MPYRSRISVFDLDLTLVTCNSSFWFCQHLRSKKVISSSAFLKAFWFRLRHDFTSTTLKQLHRDIFECLLRGLSIAVMEKHIETFIHNCILANLYFPVFQELRLAQHCGSHTIIMSSSPAFLVSRVAQILGVDEWVATEYHLDNAQRLIDVKSFLDGEAKAKALQAIVEKKRVGLDQVVAYSDSYHDLPLLCLAGVPVAVNPDAKLQAHSLENKWQIL